MTTIEHQLIPIEAGSYKFECEVCGKLFKQNHHLGFCLGVKVYEWGKWGELLTKKQMSEAGFQTGNKLPKPVGACYRAKSPNGVMWLYDPSQGIPKKQLTQEEKDKRKAAVKASRMCPQCGIRERWQTTTRTKRGWTTYKTRLAPICQICQDENDDELRRADLAEWARGLCGEGFLVLDTETSGLLECGKAEILEIAIINQDGETLLNTRLKPLHPEINQETGAYHINGIDATKLGDCPSFADIYPQLAALLNGQNVVIYNAEFDCSMLRRMCHFYGLPVLEYKPECAMLRYSEWVGDWSEYHGDYRWQPLEGGDHTALGDAKATLDVVNGFR